MKEKNQREYSINVCLVLSACLVQDQQLLISIGNNLQMWLLYATEYWSENSGPYILKQSCHNIQKLSVGLLSIDEEKEKRIILGEEKGENKRGVKSFFLKRNIEKEKHADRPKHEKTLDQIYFCAKWRKLKENWVKNIRCGAEVENILIRL